jgi:hypothetical protein
LHNEILLKALLEKDWWQGLPAGRTRCGGAALDGDLMVDPQPAERLPIALVDVTDDVGHCASSLYFPCQVKHPANTDESRKQS